ncbi:three-helix bundle dimerization domain-containing protein [Amycolatopsis decaplanina]|uniref:three-helix bundle dimerization domain-containing protein n=1 Tax=Amycolatopsis decaplanina TaxID=208441 RepID=UPI00190F6203|nr:hypothetical protein [Amycolatopsis decaplanina]
MTDARTIGDISSGRLHGHPTALADRLARSYPAVSPETVSRLVRNEFDRFARARVRVFVHILVERAARQQLDRWPISS